MFGENKIPFLHYTNLHWFICTHYDHVFPGINISLSTTYFGNQENTKTKQLVNAWKNNIEL